MGILYHRKPPGSDRHNERTKADKSAGKMLTSNGLARIWIKDPNIIGEHLCAWNFGDEKRGAIIRLPLATECFVVAEDTRKKTQFTMQRVDKAPIWPCPSEERYQYEGTCEEFLEEIRQHIRMQ